MLITLTPRVRLALPLVLGWAFLALHEPQIATSYFIYTVASFVTGRGWRS